MADGATVDAGGGVLSGVDISRLSLGSVCWRLEINLTVGSATSSNCNLTLFFSKGESTVATLNPLKLILL